MDSKNSILESWIMVEHLSEGNISLRDKNLKTWNDLHEENYYDLLKSKVEDRKLNDNQKRGIVLYFNIFSFNKIVELLRKKYHLSQSQEKIEIGEKFSFALYFDKELILNAEMTFFTMSYYIKQFKNIPSEKEFDRFEKEAKKYIEELFDFNTDTDFEESFNLALKKLLNKFSVNIEQCRMKVVSNIETDETNLHSFYVKDLEFAKHIDSKNLDTYLLGKNSKRIDLDCRPQSDKFNPDIIQEILRPSNFPVSRFPTNPKHALSLMQQVAVNLAIGFDDKNMRSVNGPPGTGKTTLLRDIFSELIVQQAVDICNLSNKVIKGSKETRYYKNGYIGKMPDSIAQKGIVVASSNNGAVQNIVNEIPLTSEISETFRRDIFEADYFKDIANSKISDEGKEGKKRKFQQELKSEPIDDKDKYWGVFSLEGGKNDNMKYVLTVLRHILSYLNEDYEPNEEIYDNFMIQYQKAHSYKENRQKFANDYAQFQKLSREFKIKKRNFLVDKAKKEESIEEKNKNNTNEIQDIKEQKTRLDDQLQFIVEKINELQNEKKRVNESLQALKIQKPSWFSWGKERQIYKDKQKDYSNQLLLIIGQEKELDREKNSIVQEQREITNRLKKLEQKPNRNKILLKNWIQKNQYELETMREKINDFKEDLNQINALDMDLDYDQIQKSSPWFDEDYRIMQSKLFIDALKVRKQFLYENRKNLNAASIIWDRQNDYLDNKLIITQAWNWINMAIPVIGTTFASVSRMCANFEKETIGHLFIDEAGQALPQASVGAIFKSRYTMAVGDPAQIKPVLTLDSSILRLLGKSFNVSEKYLSEIASTQTLLDEASQYGFYKDEEEWIGIPLWVHRRCKYPMFSISNEISYDGNMVQSTEANGRAEWYDIRGNATDKYVKEQGEFLKKRISEMIEDNPDIKDKSKKDLIYVISPFKNVADNLAKELDKIGFTRYDENNKCTNVGTVHTFQGKEAAIVFMVLGADTKSTSAAYWAVGSDNPNIMNVATTRAKEEFYIIGDKQLYMNLNSDVINNTNKIINLFNK
uniref:AAA domain-containing protein n=1 Tax=Aerococcus urinaeequi TaxID=51665 RepID=UPI00242AA8AF|nr:AAA domain-containing protein [Aerococcus urinaeequi]